MTAVDRVLQCTEVWGGNQLVEASVRMSGLDAWVYCKPHAQADGGGDVYYVSSCVTGRITRLLVADVSGHGDTVSALAGDLRALMRQHVNHLDQVSFVRRMNDQFLQRAKAGTFATAVVTTFFAPTGALEVCNAGHPPPLLFSAREKTWRFLEPADEPSVTPPRAMADLQTPSTPQALAPANIPLGILDMAEYEQFRVALFKGDLVVCYTDSFPEVRRPDGTQLGQQGLLDLVQPLRPTDPRALIFELVARVSAWSGSPLEGDDVTLLLFSPNPATARVGFARRVLACPRIIGHLAADVIQGNRPRLPDLHVAGWAGTWVTWFERTWKK